MVRFATTVVVFVCIVMFGVIDARGAGMSLALAPNDYVVTDPYSYDASRPYAGGWNRGADVVAAGGVVRALTHGRVAFSGTVAGRRVVTVQSTIGGTPVIVTYTGMRDGTLRVGDVIGARDVIGSAHALHVGAYVAGDHHRYVPITTDHAMAPPPGTPRGGHAGVLGRKPPANDASSRSPTADAIANRLRDAIEGAARTVRVAPLARADRARAPVPGDPADRDRTRADAATQFVRSRAMLRTQLARAWPVHRAAETNRPHASNASARTNSDRATSLHAAEIARTSLARGGFGLDVAGERSMLTAQMQRSDSDERGLPDAAHTSGAHVAGGATGAGSNALPVRVDGPGKSPEHMQSVGRAALAAESTRSAALRAIPATVVEPIGPVGHRRMATAPTKHGDRSARSVTIAVLSACAGVVAVWLSHRQVRRRRGSRRPLAPVAIHRWRLPVPHPLIIARPLLRRRSRGGDAQRVRLPNTHGPAMRQMRRRPREPA